MLALTCALGAALAMTVPSFQATVPDVVPRELLVGAVALNGVAINLARAIGPALGGAIVALASATALFGLEAAVVVVALLTLAALRSLPAGAREREQLGAAFRVGAGFALRHRPLVAVLLRAAAFVLPASALWALLPVVAGAQLDLGASGYGLLLGCLGAGAVLGATLLPRLRAKLGLDRLVAGGSLVTALVLVLLAVLHSAPVAAAALLVCGGAWIAVLSSLNAAAQFVAPAWARARALGAYQTVFQGGLDGATSAGRCTRTRRRRAPTSRRSPARRGRSTCARASASRSRTRRCARGSPRCRRRRRTAARSSTCSASRAPARDMLRR